MSIRHMKKEIPGFHYFCLYTEQFTGTNLFQFLQDRAVLLNMQNVHLLFINIIFPLSVPTYLYFDAAKFSIKQLSFIYLTVSVVRQRNEYEIVTETRPIKTRIRDQLSLPRDTKILIIEPSSYEIKYT